MKKVFFIAGESSGDMHAGSLLQELYKIIPPRDLTVRAIGSTFLENAGARIFFDSKYLGSMGLTEVVSKLAMYLNLERELLFELSVFRPDILILVDFPGFNLRIAKKVKKLLPDTKIVYYFPPQVWAWNEGRTKTLSKYCDLVLCGLPFEEEFHRLRGVNAFYVGNPLVTELESESERFDREKVRTEFGVSKDEILIGLFPGSRSSEIGYMFSVLLEAAVLLVERFPKCRFLISQARTVQNLEFILKTFLQLKTHSVHHDKFKLLPPDNENNHKLLCASDIAWLKSGTVTLEAALYETPMILGYRGNFLNYLLYLIFKKINIIGLPNIIAGEVVAPELIQKNANFLNYFQITKDWLENPDKLNEIKTNLKKVREKLGDKNASKEAALRIRELIPEYKVVVIGK